MASLPHTFINWLITISFISLACFHIIRRRHFSATKMGFIRVCVRVVYKWSCQTITQHLWEFIYLFISYVCDFPSLSFHVCLLCVLMLSCSCCSPYSYSWVVRRVFRCELCWNWAFSIFIKHFPCGLDSIELKLVRVKYMCVCGVLVCPNLFFMSVIRIQVNFHIPLSRGVSLAHQFVFRTYSLSTVKCFVKLP